MTALAVNLNSDIFTGTLYSGMFRSSDNGDSWTEINNGLAGIRVRSLAINKNGDIFAGNYSSQGSGLGIFRSTDNGDNWTEINNGVGATHFTSIVINSNGVIFGGLFGVFRSEDNGDSWVEVSTRITYSLAVGSDGYIFAGTEDGLFRSIDNGDNWTAVNFGLGSNLIDALVINSNGDIFAGADFFAKIFRSTDSGDNWTVSFDQRTIGIHGLK